MTNSGISSYARTWRRGLVSERWGCGRGVVVGDGDGGVGFLSRRCAGRCLGSVWEPCMPNPCFFSAMIGPSHGCAAAPWVALRILLFSCEWSIRKVSRQVSCEVFGRSRSRRMLRWVSFISPWVSYWLSFPHGCARSWLSPDYLSSSMVLHSIQMNLGLVSDAGKRMARLWDGSGRPVWDEYCEHRRL